MGNIIMRKTLAAISTYVAGAFASEQNLGEFIQYVGQHGKSYNTMEEFQMRFERYNRADSYIKEHYQKNGAEPSFNVAHNKFSDWTEQEYKVLLGYKPMKGKKRTPKGMKVVDVSALPASVNWRDHNAVTPVKNQAHCGSCWASLLPPSWKELTLSRPVNSSLSPSNSGSTVSRASLPTATSLSPSLAAQDAMAVITTPHSPGPETTPLTSSWRTTTSTRWLKAPASTRAKTRPVSKLYPTPMSLPTVHPT